MSPLNKNSDSFPTLTTKTSYYAATCADATHAGSRERIMNKNMQLTYSNLSEKRNTAEDTLGAKRRF